MTQTRQTFVEELDALQQDLVRMGSLAADAVQAALDALTTREPKYSDRVMELEDAIDALNLDIERRAVQLIALQQPLARDLRLIASTMRIIADIERIGDYSVDIARQARKLGDEPLMKPLVDIPRMAAAVQQMLHDALKALVQRDLDLAAEAVRQDDQVDHLYRALGDELVAYASKDPALVRQAMSLLLIGTYLERMADHVTNIGERLWYIETGDLKELHE